MKATRIAYSKNINPGKYAVLEEQARRLGAIRSEVWQRYGSIAGVKLSSRQIRDNWLAQGRTFNVLANPWKETLRDAKDPNQKWPICPISVSCEKFYPRKVNDMPAVKFFARLDLDQIRLFLNGHYLQTLLFFIILNAFLIAGCSHSGGGAPAGSIFLAANNFFAQGNYEAALCKYRKLMQEEHEAADRALFEMGVIYAHPSNDRKSYQKALECFRKIINGYPDSEYRRDSQMMMFQIQNVIIKDHLIAEQQIHIDTYRRRIESQENEIMDLQKKIRTLEQKVFELRKEPVDRVLIEKKKRRLTLISKGETIKTYKIALGGNPVGPKERQGDKKTPEGTYIIDSRNRHSDYHLSLRISYPNEKNKRRAKELGVSPGGDVMIHGLKNSLSWVGGFHTEIDWTEGCIAVTNEEMEEIARLVPNGTPVEIRP